MAICKRGTRRLRALHSHNESIQSEGTPARIRQVLDCYDTHFRSRDVDETARALAADQTTSVRPMESVKFFFDGTWECELIDVLQHLLSTIWRVDDKDVNNTIPAAPFRPSLI